MKHLAAIFCLAGLIAFRAMGQEQPPATRPATVIAPPLPEQFQILLTRSIFARDGIAVPHSAVEGMGPGSSSAAGPAAAAGAASGPVLRGVVLEDGTYTAILEDPTTHQLLRIKEGGMLAGGRVRRLTLRGFEHSAGDKETSVALGQNLHGEMIAPPVAVAKAAPAQPTSAPGGPPANAAEAMQAGAKIEGAADANAVAERGGHRHSYGAQVN